MKKPLPSKSHFSFKSRTRDHHFRVAIFGSARIHRRDPEYKDIRHLAKKIAERGIDIVTGGGPGVMEAANRGHQEGRGNRHNESFGLTIHLPREQLTNKHVDIKREFHRFSKRLDDFMFLSHAVIVSPGGVGTLLEFFYSWQLVQVHKVYHIPIILLGDMWKDLLRWVKKWPVKKGFLDPDEMDCLCVAKNAKEAMSYIRQAHEKFLEGKGRKRVGLKIKKANK